MGKKDEVSEFKDNEMKIQKSNADYIINQIMEEVDEPYLKDITSAAGTAEKTREKTQSAMIAAEKCKEQERRINVITDNKNGKTYRIGVKSRTMYLEEV